MNVARLRAFDCCGYAHCQRENAVRAGLRSHPHGTLPGADLCRPPPRGRGPYRWRRARRHRARARLASAWRQFERTTGRMEDVSSGPRGWGAAQRRTVAGSARRLSPRRPDHRSCCLSRLKTFASDRGAFNRRTFDRGAIDDRGAVETKRPDRFATIHSTSTASRLHSIAITALSQHRTALDPLGQIPPSRLRRCAAGNGPRCQSPLNAVGQDSSGCLQRAFSVALCSAV